MEDAKKTTVFSKSNPLLRRALLQQNTSDEVDNSLAEGTTEILLLIRGMVERTEITEGKALHLGRYDITNEHQIDLTPYGAADRGVSRNHAKIVMQDGQIYLIDNSSTNGTFIHGKRIEPETPTPLYKGNEILFGRLSVQVMFR